MPVRDQQKPGEGTIAVADSAVDNPLDREAEGKIHRVDPKFASWPRSLTGNPYKRLKVDPNSGSNL
jgi:hypothetical protein